MNTQKRQLVLDTETTGISHENGHKIIEIGIVELIDRKETGRVFHHYLEPDREIEADAVRVHGLDNETIRHLSNGNRFGDIYEELMAFIGGDELVIHNAAFDMGFLDAEMRRIGKPQLSGTVAITDTLRVAQNKYHGKRNTLDALCVRLGIDNTHREDHGALVDAKLLAMVYLELTKSQNTLDLNTNKKAEEPISIKRAKITYTPVEPFVASSIPIVSPTESELDVHKRMIGIIAKKSGDIEFSF